MTGFTGGLLITVRPNGLSKYLARPIEPNWLYLPNRYIQYTNALCVAQELQDAGDGYDHIHFRSLPDQFAKFIAEEVCPTEMLPADLFDLKQRAQGTGPHHEFPLRSGTEKSFMVESQQRPLGDLTFSQVLREAYPGAVYYYMAQPFRILRVNHQAGEIMAVPESRYTTKPLTQIMVFPDLIGGLHRLLIGAGGFVAEADMQVSERVTGFKEKRGKNETTHNYGVGSPYSQRPLQRFIKTTGVCWYFPETQVLTEAIATRILNSYCTEFAVQSRDLGIGRFHVQRSPLAAEALQGICIFDATHGSLRLSERLGANFALVVENARYAAEAEFIDDLSNNFIVPLRVLCALTRHLTEKVLLPGQTIDSKASMQSEWVEVIAPGEKALLVYGTEANEVTVLRYFFSPDGLKYQLLHEKPDVRWTAEASVIHPLNGVTKMVKYNPNTGEETPA